MLINFTMFLVPRGIYFYIPCLLACRERVAVDPRAFSYFSIPISATTPPALVKKVARANDKGARVKRHDRNVQAARGHSHNAHANMAQERVCKHKQDAHGLAQGLAPAPARSPWAQRQQARVQQEGKGEMRLVP